MRIQTEYMSFKTCWTISSSYDFQAHLQHSQRRWCFSQTAIQWFEVLPGMSPALPGLSPALPGAPRLVVGASSYSESQQECPPRVWYSPEIDASRFTLHILSDTPGGLQWLKYILLMCVQYPLKQIQVTSAKSEIGFRKWTPHTDPSPHSPQIIGATYLQSSTMLQSVQWCDCVVVTSQIVFSHLS